MTKREQVGWGWGVVLSFLLLAAALGGATRCEVPYEVVPAPVHKPGCGDQSSSERLNSVDATPVKGTGPVA